MTAPTPDRTPTGDLRDRIAEALTREHYRRASERIEAPPEEHCAGFADAVLPVIEAEILAAEVDATQRADELAARLEDAEQQRDAALAALRDLTDGRPCAPHPGNGWCQTHGERAPCPHAEAGRLLAALDQPEET